MGHAFAAVIFDLDGTLIDSEAVSVDAGRATMLDFNLPADPALLASMVGLDNVTCQKMLADRFPDLDMNAFNAGFDAHVDRIEARGMTLKPDVKEVLGDLRDAGMPVALATSSRVARANWKLSKTGLTDYFDAVVALEDVANPKPAPDPYLLAAKRLGVAPADCVVFEDSEAGVTAALGAGMHVVQVPDMLASHGRAHVTAGSLWVGAKTVGLPVRASMAC